MTDYTKLDALIFDRISAGRTQLDGINSQDVRVEANRLAAETGRDQFRVVDGRLQALRKAGRIEFKRGNGFSGGWALAAPKGN